MCPLCCPAVYNLDEADVEGQRKRFDLYDKASPTARVLLLRDCCSRLVGGQGSNSAALCCAVLAVLCAQQAAGSMAPALLQARRDACPNACPGPCSPAQRIAAPRLLRSLPQEARRMLAKRLPVPAYDHLLKLSHTFNLLDARGAVGVTGEPLHSCALLPLPPGTSPLGATCLCPLGSRSATPPGQSPGVSFAWARHLLLCQHSPSRQPGLPAVIACRRRFPAHDPCTAAERANCFATMRSLAREVTGLWLARREEQGYPLGVVPPLADPPVVKPAAERSAEAGEHAVRLLGPAWASAARAGQGIGSSAGTAEAVGSSETSTPAIKPVMLAQLRKPNSECEQFANVNFKRCS